jgi:hypothetical protein
MVFVLMNAAAIGIGLVAAAGITAVIIWREERKSDDK